MYEYLINDETVIFKSEKDMLAGLKAAETAGYSIELVRDDSMSKKADDNFMTEKTPEEQLRATQLDASGGVAGTSEASQEDFIQDPAESADVVSETVALEDTGLPQADTSLDSLLSNIPKVEEPPVLEEKEKEIPKFELEKKEDIIIEGPLGLIDPPKVGSFSGKFEKRAVKESEELRSFEATTDAVLNSNTIYQLGIEGNSVSQLMENNVAPSLRARIVDVYSKTNPNLELPSDVRIDKMVAARLEKARVQEVEEFYKEDNEKATEYKKGGLYYDAISTGFSEFTAKMNPREQNFAKLRQEYLRLTRIINTGTGGNPVEAERERILLKPQLESAFELLNNQYRTEEQGGGRKINNYTMLFNPETGNMVTPEEAEASGVATVNYTEQANELLQQYKSLDEISLEQRFFAHILDVKSLDNKLNQTFDFKANSYIPLESYGYKADPDGIYRGVKIRDLMNFRNTKTPEGKLMLNEILYTEPALDKDGKVMPYVSQEFGYLNDLASEKINLSLKGEALKNAYVLNIDPGSVEINASDYVTRFIETTAEATFGEEAISRIGTTKRKELDQAEILFSDAGIDLSDKQKEVFKRGMSMRVTEGVAGFVPVLAEFAFLNKVAGATGVVKYISNLSKGTFREQVTGLIYGALLEEAKFEAVTRGEAKTGGGAGFFAGGKIAGAALPKFIGMAATKVIGGAFGGVGGAETAKIAEALIEDLEGSKAFETSMNEYYGDMDEATSQIIVDGIVFGLLGAQNIKSTDFYTMSKRRRVYTEIAKEINEGKYKGKELEKKMNLASELSAQIALADQAFNKADIGRQKSEAEASREVLRTGKYKDGTPLSESDRLIEEKIVNQYEANVTSAQRRISQAFDNVVKSGIFKGDVKLVITEGKELLPGGLEPGNKAQYDPIRKTFKVDLLQYKPGVFAQEVGHAFMDMAFKNNPEVAKVFKNKIQKTVDTAFKDMKFTAGGESNLTFQEAIDISYPGAKNKPAEEYVMNVVEFLAKPSNKALLLENGVLGNLKRNILNTATDIGLPYNTKKNLTTGAEVLEFLADLGRVAEGGSATAIKNKFEQFKNIIIDGKKLKNVYGEEILSDKEAAEVMGSAEIKAEEKKDIFSKATKNYTDMIESGSSAEQAGVMVGYDFAPLVRKKLRSYIDKKGLEIPDAIIEDIISDVTLSSGKGSTGIPSLVQSYTKGRNLIDYIKENPQATSADISKKAEEFGVRSDRVQSFTDLAKEGGEATMTSYVFGQLNNRILASMQKPEFRDIFNTFSIDKDPTKAANIAEGEGLGGAPTGFVDISSPEQTIRVERIKAEAQLKLPVEVKEEINTVGEKVLLSTPLTNIEALSIGSVKLADGKTANVVMLANNKADITIDGVTERITARSPKVVEKYLDVPAKSFKKSPTTKDQLKSNAVDLIYTKLEKEAGTLRDNYTATPEYTAFIDNAFPLLKKYISQSSVNKRFKEFKKPVIDPATGKQKREKTAAGKPIFTKENITLAEWRKYFIGDGSTRIDGRRRSIIEALSAELGFDSIMESLMKESMRKQIESRQEDIGVDLLENYVEVIAKEIDRGNIGAMASKVIEIVNKYGVDPMDLFYDKAGKFRNIYDIIKSKAGIEAVAEVEASILEDTRLKLNKVAEQEVINTSMKAKLKEKGIDYAEEFDSVKSASLKQLKDFDQFIEEAISYIPDFMETSTLNSFSKHNGGLIASMFAFEGRRYVPGDKRPLGAPVFREKFIDQGKFGTKKLPANIKKMWEDVEKYAKDNGLDSNNLSISYKSRSFFKGLEKIQYSTYPGTRAQKQKAIDNLPGRKEAIIDITIKEKVLEAFLATIGEASKGKEGAELKKFAISVGKIFLNNDGTGIRRYSAENYIELGIDPNKTIPQIDKKTGKNITSKAGIKNEHLNSRVQFGAEVITTLLEGNLTPDNIKKLTSQYLSVIGSKNGQIFTDKLLGATVENSAVLKMLVSRMFDKGLKTIDITTLKDFYNWRTKGNAYSEMIEAYVEAAIKQPLLADKALKQANIDMIKAYGVENMIVPDVISSSVFASKTIIIDKAFEKGRDPNKEPKGISVFDFDDTLARTKSNVLYTMPDGTKGKLNATEFAKKSEALEAKGAEFDFSEFSKVMQGKLGPLFSEAKKKEGKYTNKDVFVLTARPANSAQAIYEFLKSEGLEIPINNIVGLGDGAAKAKAEWMIGKVAEGYNDFYFADDAIKNVEAVRDALGLFDVKSKVQQAIMASKKITLEKGLAEMIERKKGISSKEPISAAIASNLGKKKGRYDWFIPPNAEDFAGLMYKFYGKGEQGDKDMALIKKALIRPFNRAENAISTYKQTLGNDYSALESKMGDLNVSMSKETKASLEQANVNADQATRVFIYNKLGYKIPGLEKNEIANISKIVNGDARLSAYAEGVMGITKTKEIFPRPGDTWYSSNIRYELFKYSTEGVRGHFLKDWQKNVDEMFTEENFNRIEAGYGKNYVSNLKEILARMKTGKTRSADLGKDVQAGMDYVNGSVGVIMFLNTRSAVLQTISAVNYVNWSDNNPLQIGKAVAKPKEWGKTFMEIYNSDFLKQRRGGLEINVEEAEIAKAVERSKGNARNLYDSMIKIGFKPTQMADSFAIAFGGTPFLMNRTATYVKQGLSAEAARKRAFEDFREVSEESQQSSRQDRVSNIQTGVAGRLIFAFANTPMQMSRMTKKAALDLANNRGDAKTNISKMLYYGAVQSYIFYALQQSQFLRLFGGDDEDMTQEQKDFNKANNDKKNTRIANSMFDSFISGSGSPGKVAITAKNTIMKYYLEKEKGYKADYGNVINEALSISPPLSSKTKKIYSAFKTYKYYSTKQGQKELEEYGQYAFDNPMLMANAKVFSSVSNVPADRLIQKVNNLYSAFTDETLTPIQSAALAAGWDKWSLGLYDPKFMSEEEIATNKAARKEQLKKEKIAKKEAAISSYDMKMSEPERREILKVLSKKQQMDSLGALEVSIKRRRELYKMKEIDRIEEIIRLQNKRQFYIETRNLNQTRQDSLK
jgi:hypothetical protein